ncbi:T9SS type A sorting domain-containing protein [bacterium]|nr:T9SS type A sorting domain-containing protein [bacterium]
MLSFFDGELHTADWWDTTAAYSGSGASSANLATGGNPDEHRSVTMSLAGFGGAMYIGLKPGASIALSATGGVDSLTMRNDYRCPAGDGCFGDGQAWGIAVRQDGQIYISGSGPFLGVQADWVTSEELAVTEFDLCALDLPGYPTWRDCTEHPDFSSAGSPLEMGYFRWNTSSGGYNLSSGLDNWGLDAHVPSLPTSAVELRDRPLAPFLGATAPNPFRESTRVEFRVPSTREVSLDVLDLRGRRVRTLARGTYSSGHYAAIWNGLDSAGNRLPAGIYFCRLEVGDTIFSRRVTLIR